VPCVDYKIRNKVLNILETIKQTLTKSSMLKNVIKPNFVYQTKFIRGANSGRHYC